MPTAEIITIGTELLLGEIQDTNTRYLARMLRELGINLYRSTIIGDNVIRISEAILEGCKRADILLITGGLGPTVDDPTREAVATAAGVPLLFKEELWQQILRRFEKYGRTPTENNKRQAHIPEGATPIKNEVGTAPAFCMTLRGCLLITFPGVPKELEYIFEHEATPLIQQKFPSEDVILVKVLHAAGIGESMVDDLIGELEKSANPTVGLLAHPGQVDIRITARAKTKDAAQMMIASMENPIRSWLDEHIYGVDQQTIEEVILAQITQSQMGIELSFVGFPDEIKTRVDTFTTSVDHAKHPSTSPHASFLFSYIPGTDRQGLELSCNQGGIQQSDKRYYGGPPSLGPLWAINTSFDFIRSIINR